MKIFGKIAVISFIVWFAGLVVFSCSLEFDDTDSFSSSHSASSVIVVFTGAGGRIEKGFSMLLDGVADYMLISGAGKGITLQQILNNRSIVVRKGNEYIDIKLDIGSMMSRILEYRDNIFIGYEAGDTRGNAKEVAEWLEEHDYIDTIYLVTSNYHMPRSMLELRRFVDDMGGFGGSRAITIVEVPVVSKSLGDGGAGAVVAAELNMLSHIFMEYHKYLFVRLFWFV